MTPADVTPYLHFSVDDVFGCLHDAFTGAYASPFAQPTFAYLRHLHERYGLCVSLYCFAEDAAVTGWRLAHADERFAAEFAAAASWLRFGFHALNAGTRYSAGVTSAEAARAHHDEVAAAIVRFATPAALDRAPRLHYYTGSLAAVRAMADGPHGLLGLLTADDDRAEVYYLDDETRRLVREEGSLRDPTTGLELFSTDLRLERLEQDVGEIVAVAGRRAASVGEGPPSGTPEVRPGPNTHAGSDAHARPGVHPEPGVHAKPDAQAGPGGTGSLLKMEGYATSMLQMPRVLEQHQAMPGRQTAMPQGPRRVPGARAFTHEQYLTDERVRDRLARLAREWNALGWRSGFPLDEAAT